MSTNYYELLGVDRSASPEQIKRAYRRLAKELHPDVNPDPGAEARFKEVSKAYETLSDPDRRARYDQFGTDDPSVGGFGPGFGGGLDDLLGMFMDGFGFNQGRGPGGRGRTGPPRGPDLETRVDLAFEEAVFGVERDVTVRTLVTCGDCSGSGAAEGSTVTACHECGGSGQVRRARPSILGQMVSVTPCTRCGGSGELIPSPCTGCRGEGRVQADRTFTVVVPAGVDAGTTLRLGGRGAVGQRGGAAGDLYVHIAVAPHEYLQRDGSNLYHRLPLTFAQAALGVSLTYPTLDGDEEIEVPRGTQTGAVLRLRGKGVPSVQGRGRGDLLIELTVETPEDLDDEQEQLLRRLAELRGEPVAEAGRGFFARLRSAIR